MGIQDRDYYRDGPSVLDTLMPAGIVCRWLIAINIAVFFLQLVAKSTAGQFDDNAPIIGPTDGWVTDWFILDPAEVQRGQVWRLLTYAFLHETTGIWHIVFNMIFLWWFGSDLEQLYGRREFTTIYLSSAVLGGLAYFGWSLARAQMVPCLGASGAVTMLLVLCAFHFPRRVIYLVAIIPGPIGLFALVSVARDAYTWAVNAPTQTAVVVHLAGAAFAVVYFQWQGSIVDAVSRLKWWNQPMPRPRLKLYNPEPHQVEEPVGVAAKSSSQVVADEHLEAKLDAVLEKIASKGKDSLTTQEEEILRQAAAMYKRRRG